MREKNQTLVLTYMHSERRIIVSDARPPNSTLFTFTTSLLHVRLWILIQMKVVLSLQLKLLKKTQNYPYKKLPLSIISLKQHSATNAPDDYHNKKRNQNQ
ncbi:hypothetical protein CT0861_13201 [Colletotrichum tofieldiae]|uniref:Uncharacterized protein n=1 Tax=Colletotrichum tofieldiae TaxID=708197 RepID=A0A161VXU2_9PEZI|nr:hypothetical protein CT0861_13201 [Colletotrichum tofieldiae]